MFSSVVPFRAVAYQFLFLLVAIAVEATVLRRFLQLSPKQSVQYAASINLLCTIVGWVAFFLLYTVNSLAVGGLDPNLLNFIFFDRWSGTVATSLIVIAFLMFFASFGIKQLGLVALKWYLYPDERENKQLLAEEPSPPDATPRTKAIRVLRQDDDEPRPMQPQIRAVLVANAWSFTAILAILMLRFLFRARFIISGA
ncbi:MAG TPA: filament integrity protein FraC [Allocoleopsis sp.]